MEMFTRRALVLPTELRQARELGRALDRIEQRWPPDIDPKQDAEQPVFLLSAGWRSGSTLLQRLVCSSGEIVLWGEPLDDTATIPRMAHTLQALSQTWPPDSYFANAIDLASFSNRWIANITPPIEALRKAHRAFLDEWLAKPARDIYGAPRWGLKEVRLSVEHARYLRWLYPNARFVFVYRNLVDAYRSWRGNTWGGVWPGYYSWSPVAYARHWKLLLSGYLEGCEDLGGFMVKYEDLIGGKVDLQALADYIGVSHIDSAVLDKRIASPDKKRKKRIRWITPMEKGLLRLVAGRLMKRVGYV